MAWGNDICYESGAWSALSRVSLSRKCCVPLGVKGFHNAGPEARQPGQHGGSQEAGVSTPFTRLKEKAVIPIGDSKEGQPKSEWSKVGAIYTPRHAN